MRETVFMSPLATTMMSVNCKSNSYAHFAIIVIVRSNVDFARTLHYFCSQSVTLAMAQMALSPCHSVFSELELQKLLRKFKYWNI